ncbi:hypothetical protein Tco_1242805 [Tanacetum coccineum]
MTTLQFADTHNLVAFLSKPAESEGFKKIVDFLNANPIRYALTINPTIYTSSLVDGKKIIITESIVRRDLQLEDAKGIDCLPNATIFEQLTLMGAKTTAWNEFSSTMASAIICLATNQKFNFSKYIFESMVKNLENVSEEMGEGSANPSDPHHIPTIIQPSTSQPQKKQKPKRPKRKDTEIPQSSGPTDNVADEAVYEEMDDSLEWAATTATSLDAELDRRVNTPRSDEDSLKLKELIEFYTKLQQRVLDLENTKTAQAHKITSLKLRVKKLEKKGGSRTHKLKRLYKVGRSARMVSSDDASLGVLDDEEVFSGQDMDENKINVAAKEVSTAGPVTTAGEVVTTAGPTETTTADDLTLAQTLIKIRSAKSKVKGVVIGEQSKFTTRTRPQQLPSKDKGKGIMEEPGKPTKKKDQIKHDEEVAQRLQAQMQAELEEEDRLVSQREEEANIVSWDNVQAMIDADYQMAQQMQAEEQEKLSIKEKSKLFVQLLEARKKHFAAIRAKEKRNKPLTKAQKRNTMSTYLKNMAGYKHNQLKNKIFDDIQKAEAEIAQESSSKRAGTELEQESSKKQKVDEDKETTELQRLIEVVPNEEEVAIDVIPLATKPPSIVDYKIHKEGKKTYYQIIRTDGSSKMYLVFSYMLKSFDREDLETLWKLVKAKHGSTRPDDGYERVLWGDLKTMFDPHVKDQVWRNQQDYRVLD